MPAAATREPALNRRPRIGRSLKAMERRRPRLQTAVLPACLAPSLVWLPRRHDAGCVMHAAGGGSRGSVPTHVAVVSACRRACAAAVACSIHPAQHGSTQSAFGRNYYLHLVPLGLGLHLHILFFLLLPSTTTSSIALPPGAWWTVLPALFACVGLRWLLSCDPALSQTHNNN
jgi:hypothetical protein